MPDDNLFSTLFDGDFSEEEGRRGMERAAAPLLNWRQRADQFINDHLFLEFTADDLVRVCGLPTQEDGRPTNNGIGGYLNGLARRFIIRKEGYVNSERVTNHARVLRVWRVIMRIEEAS